MSVMEKPRTMIDFFTREQQPGESYAQFAMALQAILARAYPPSLKAQLRPLEHAGIVELIKAATYLSATRATTTNKKPHPVQMFLLNQRVTRTGSPNPHKSFRVSTKL
ncbi:unnamed protein product [Hymenolepis diminuta]|uniref:Uncharacterized protein n=1 Tax=Hymenolepis diminuta TaxID=6216 RepID=A0A564XWL3_HYMDI|nr:unnamed protein product [Hymenolepis diminuta]